MLSPRPILSLRNAFSGPNEGESLEHIDVLVTPPGVPPHAGPGSAHEASRHSRHSFGAGYPIPLASIRLAAPPVGKCPPPLFSEKGNARLLYTCSAPGDMTLVGTLRMGKWDVGREPNGTVAPSLQAPVCAPIEGAGGPLLGGSKIKDLGHPARR